MKRIGLIGICFGMVLLLTGCGNKSLQCTSAEDNEEQVYTLNFDSKEMLESGTFLYRYVLNEDEIPYFDTIVETIESTYTSENFEGLDIQVSDNGKDTIEVQMNFTADQMSEITGSELDDSATYDYIKEDLEDSGFICE